MIRLRPSSHSDDYTLIATYEDEKTAKKAYGEVKRLLKDMEEDSEWCGTDWGPDEAHVDLRGNKVLFNVYTAGALEEVETVLSRRAKEVECYVNYQEVVITAELPKDLTPETAALVLEREEGEAVKGLTAICGRPKVKDRKDRRVFEWFYAGEKIYSEDERILYLPEREFDLWKRENWKAEVVG